MEIMAIKKKTAKPKAVREEPIRWTIQVNRELLEPVTEMAGRLGMTIRGAGSVALKQWLIKQQAEAFTAGDGKGEA